MARAGLIKKSINTKRGRRTYWIRAVEPADLSKLVGTTKYYAARARDYKNRTGKAPPAYYMGYGDKYVRRFTQQTRKKLSPAGKTFVDKTMFHLQRAIEERRRRNPMAFAKLEASPEKLKAFAYKTHAPAYIRGGIARLGTRDLVKIGLTPDIRDILTRQGVRQAATVARAVAKRRLQ